MLRCRADSLGKERKTYNSYLMHEVLADVVLPGEWVFVFYGVGEEEVVDLGCEGGLATHRGQ